jgi:putative nucleotidyltransferase with HDIG domain
MATKRILIVDDEAYFESVIGPMLEAESYCSVLARDSTDALRRLSSDSLFDLIVMDIMVKGMDGLGLLERLREKYPEVPVIMISAARGVALGISAMKKGAFDYLLKPLDRQQLLNTIRRALEESDRDREVNLHRQDLERLVEARTELLSRAMADLERSYDITLEALGNALDLKDAETEGHSKRVTAYSIVLARAMRIDSAQVKVIARGAFLHDIGKMAIPDAILSKPGQLNAEEQAIMREHCLRGYTIVKKIPFLEEASEIVFSHQERYDGTGYSRGLKGNEIPLGARIFSVADTLDAITSNRPYREARSFAHARQEIERCSGTQFDPAIVDVYRTLPDSLWEDLRTEIDQPSASDSLALTETIGTR